MRDEIVEALMLAFGGLKQKELDRLEKHRARGTSVLCGEGAADLYVKNHKG